MLNGLPVIPMDICNLCVGKPLGGLAGKKAVKECRGDMSLLEIGIVENSPMERDRRLDAFDDKFIECATHPCHGFLAVTSVRN